MSEYKRLTKREGKEVKALEWDGEILHRLAELEDKIENRELVFINKPFYSQDRQCWGIYQRVGDIVETCFMTEQQAKEYSMRSNTLITNQYTFHKL